MAETSGRHKERTRAVWTTHCGQAAPGVLAQHLRLQTILCTHLHSLVSGQVGSSPACPLLSG